MTVLFCIMMLAAVLPVASFAVTTDGKAVLTFSADTHSTVNNESADRLNARIDNKQEDDPASACEHVWGEWSETTTPTCTNAGEETRECSVCHETETRVIPAQHELEEHAAVEPTCTTPGSIAYYACNRCHQSFKDAAGTEPIMSSGWNLVDHLEAGKRYVITYNDGEKLYAMKLVGESYYKSVQFKEITQDDLTDELEVEFQWITEDAGDGYYIHSAKENTYLSHTDSKVQYITTDGSEVWQYADGHLFYVSSSDTVYSVSGLNTYSYPSLSAYSSVQIDLYVYNESDDELTIPARGHHIVFHDAKEATCTEDGSLAYWMCDREGCGKCYRDANGEQEIAESSLVIAAVGHTPGEPEETNRVEATCTTAGSYDSVVCCSVCHEEISRETVTIPALGHDFGEWTQATAPTCTEVGEETRHCTRCSAADTRSVDALGHEWTLRFEWAETGDGVTADAVYSCANNEQHVCRVSADVKELENEEIQPTCTEGGMKKYSAAAWGRASRFTDGDEYIITIMNNDKEYAICLDGFDVSFAQFDIENLEGIDAEYKWAVDKLDTDEYAALSVCNDGYNYNYMIKGTAANTDDSVVYYIAIQKSSAPESFKKWQYQDNHLYCKGGFVVSGIDDDGRITLSTDADEAATVRLYAWTRGDKTVEIPATGHTPAKAVRENEVPATCIEAGSYDEVVYCSNCGNELSRTPMTSTALGHDWGDWTQMFAPTSTEAGEEQRACSRCSAKEVRPIPATAAIRVLGHTLTLKGEIGFNTYLLFSDDILHASEDYQVEYWKNGKNGTKVFEKKVSEVTPVTKKSGENEYLAYGFSVVAYAKEMDTVFTMRIKEMSTGRYIDFTNSNGAVISGDAGLDYRINDYLNDRLNNSTNTKMIALAQAMKDYGVYAKHYLDVLHGETEPLPDVEGFVTISADTMNPYAYRRPDDIEDFTYEGTTLVLEEDTTFRMYFRSENKNRLIITVADIDEPLTINDGKGQYEGMYYVEIKNIFAKNLDKMYDFTISNGSEETTAHHGPFGYVSWALTSGSPDLQYAMMALYHYNQMAKDYFN